jgi:SAM-dependent MidA family methyltransferase
VTPALAARANRAAPLWYYPERLTGGLCASFPVSIVNSLPPASQEALQHSRRVVELIRGEIAASGGWISFARYMELALYAPGLGYYSAGADKFGPGGDFVTAPEISGLFGRALARQLAQIIAATDGSLLELGAGSGRLAADLLSELMRLKRLPRRYCILELGAELRERQRITLTRSVPGLLDRVVWLERVPSAFAGAIIANEVLDAVPAHALAWREPGIFERGVAMQADGFVWREKPLEAGLLYAAAAQIPVVPDYESEINLAAAALVETLATALQRGIILIIDYGFPAREYYHPQRSSGTLMCHYRHYALSDPFHRPGLQDITTHVDFTAVARAGLQAGMAVMGYATQAEFLLSCGLTDILAETSSTNAAAYFPLASQVQRLTSPAEMGELYKVIALGRGLGGRLLAFPAGAAGVENRLGTDAWC